MISQEELLAEQANLDQQEAAARLAIQAATLQLEAVLGAKQMVSHLLKKCEGNSASSDSEKAIEEQK